MVIMRKTGCRAIAKGAVLWLKSGRKARLAVALPAGLALGLCVTATSGASAQTTATQSGNSGNSGQNSSGASGSSGATTLESVTRVQQQVSQPGPSIAPTSSTDSTYRGSLVREKVTGGVLTLSLEDAVARALRNNLGLVLQTSNLQASGGQRLQQLQNLLPTITGTASITVEQVNLAAYGLKFPGLNPIVGPFQVVDFRAYLTQNLVNIQSLQNYLAAKHNFESARLTAQDARDIVVLTAGNAYLLCIADAARITAVQAELATSKVSLDQAVANHEAGTSPRIDVLRAQVDF